MPQRGAGALRMQAVYYGAVVLLEVPSGWASDRFGRVLTLRNVAVCRVGAFSLFLIGGLGPVVAGQILLVAGYAFLSGTDATFHLESLDYLNTYIDYSVEHFFSDPRLVQDNLYPIIVLQYDRNNLETIYDLEDRYCSLMSTLDTDTFLNSRCNPNNRGDCADNICLLTHDGEPVGSSISGTPGPTCCYLFISDSFDANDRTSLAYVTLHEMFHIFQISNFVEYESWENDDACYISGKISGDGTEHKPWWMEGNATYFSRLHYSRATGDFEHLNREMERGLWTPYGPSGEDVIDRYLNGPDLYNVTWDSDWAVGYQVGAWFVAYVAHHEGEQAVIDFWINTQDGTRFPENFEQTFGTDYRTYFDEFEEFIRTSDRSEVMGILPTS